MIGPMTRQPAPVTAVLAVLSNCPHVNNACNGGEPTEIRVLGYGPTDTGEKATPAP